MDPVQTNAIKTVASLKLWHVLVLVGLFAVVTYVITNHLIVRNVLVSSTGETFLRNSFLKPIKADKAKELADKAVAAK